MKKIAIVIVLLAIGFVAYSQSAFDPKRVVLGEWVDMADDEIFEFFPNGTVRYMIYVRTTTSKGRYWEAYTGTFTVEENTIKIHYTKKLNTVLMQAEEVSQDVELEIFIDSTGTAVFAHGRHHFTRLH
jgi:hypothetical protein